MLARGGYGSIEQRIRRKLAEIRQIGETPAVGGSRSSFFRRSGLL